MPVLVLAGEEEFGLTRRVKELQAEYLDPAWAAFNLTRLDNPPISQISEAALTLPFGPGNKVILIERCELFTKKKSKSGTAGGEADDAKGDKGELEKFDNSLAAVAPNTYVIFACPHNFDSTLKLSKAVQKHAKFEKFEKEKYFPGSNNPKLLEWCRREANRLHVSIDDDASSYLLELSEADLRMVSSEISKAATFITPQKHITKKVVVELSPHQSHVFILADRWLSGDGKGTLQSIKELLSRQSAIPVIATLQTMISKWIHMKALCEKFNAQSPSGPGLKRRELPLQELARKVAQEMHLNEFAVQHDLRRAQKVSLETLIAKRLELTRLEDLVKTGQMPDEQALEIFLAG